MASYDLEGRVAFVTGAGQSIGEACARTLAASGARVVVTDIRGEQAAEVAADLRAAGAEAVAAPLDVTDSRAVDTAVAEVVATFGRLDVGVNNAGISGVRAPLAEVDDDGWRAVLAVNLDGVFFCTRAEVAAMRGSGGGSIINMASIMGSVAFPEQAGYTASKHAVIGLTRAAALDHAADGIRVNAVAPGFIDVPRKKRRRTAEELAGIAAMHPLGRLGTVDEVAALVTWLASDAASFATGSVYPVDGGYLAR